MFAQNGIPWWYDIGLSPKHPPVPDLAFLDPGGRLRAAIPKQLIVGGVVFSSNEVVAPGVVANLSPERNRLLIGECDDRPSERIVRLRAALNAAAIESPDVAQIRETIWSKLLTNMSMSVLCLLTGQTARAVRDDPDSRRYRAAPARRGQQHRAELLPRGQARHPLRPRAGPQAVDPAGLRTRPRHGDRRAGPRARRLRARRRTFDADARHDGGARHPARRADKGLYKD